MSSAPLSAAKAAACAAAASLSACPDVCERLKICIEAERGSQAITSAARLFVWDNMDGPSALAPNQIVEIDRATGAELNRFDAPFDIAFADTGDRVGLAYDGRSLFAASGTVALQNEVYELDPDTGAVRAVIAVPGSGQQIGLGSLRVGCIAVRRSFGGTTLVQLVDTVSGAVVDAWEPSPMAFAGAGEGATGLSASASRNSVFINSTSEVYEFDASVGAGSPRAGALVYTDAGAAMNGMAFIDGLMYIARDASPVLIAVDPDTQAIVAQVNAFASDYLTAGLGGGDGLDLTRHFFCFKVRAVNCTDVAVQSFCPRLNLTTSFVNVVGANAVAPPPVNGSLVAEAGQSACGTPRLQLVGIETTCGDGATNAAYTAGLVPVAAADVDAAPSDKLLGGKGTTTLHPGECCFNVCVAIDTAAADDLVLQPGLFSFGGQIKCGGGGGGGGGFHGCSGSCSGCDSGGGGARCVSVHRALATPSETMPCDGH